MEFLFYLVLVAAVGYYAKSKGRSPLGWGLIAIFISPLIASIILFFLKNLNTDKYDGDSTSRPIPQTPEERHQSRQAGNAKKPQVDVDESIRRMEDKLAQGRSEDSLSTVEAAGALAASTATVIPEENVSLEQTEDVAVQETVELEPVEQTVQPEEPEEVVLLPAENQPQQESVAETQVPVQAFCESCGQPLVPGAKFCTNCGAPVAK